MVEKETFMYVKLYIDANMARFDELVEHLSMNNYNFISYREEKVIFVLEDELEWTETCIQDRKLDYLIDSFDWMQLEEEFVHVRIA